MAWTEHGLICSDGSRLPADVVVFATGFVCNLKLQVSELFGPEVAASLDELWGLDEEGELRGAFKPCGRESLVQSIPVPNLIYYHLKRHFELTYHTM